MKNNKYVLEFSSIYVLIHKFILFVLVPAKEKDLPENCVKEKR